MGKKSKSKAGSGAAAVVDDPRFSSIHSDPRFKRLNKDDQKVRLDGRFKGAISDPKFAVT